MSNEAVTPWMEAAAREFAESVSDLINVIWVRQELPRIISRHAPAASREQALEEAAKRCDEEGHIWRNNAQHELDGVDEHVMREKAETCRDLAGQIRDLQSRPASAEPSDKDRAFTAMRDLITSVDPFSGGRDGDECLWCRRGYPRNAETFEDRFLADNHDSDCALIAALALAEQVKL